MSRRLTTVTGYQHSPAATALCGELNPQDPKVFCTRKDLGHGGDHYHEYSDTSWPRGDKTPH